MRLVLIIALLVAPSFADALRYTQDKKSEYSKIIEQGGEKKILLPDGRVIPFGQSTICSDSCAEITAHTSRSRAWWLIPVAGGIITALVLLPPGKPPAVRPSPPPNNPPSATPPPRRDVPSRPAAPPVEVPEPSTFVLLAGGLAMMARKFRPVLLLLVFLALPVCAETIRINPTAIDGNADARDDFWRVNGNIGTPDALFIPRVLIPSNWIRPGYAQWVSNNNGGGESEIFTRRFILPENADLFGVEFGLEFSASGASEVLINGKTIKTFADAAPNTRIFLQAKGQAIYKTGENVLQVKVKGESGLLGFICLDGYIVFSSGPDKDRTLRDFRRKGRI